MPQSYSYLVVQDRVVNGKAHLCLKCAFETLLNLCCLDHAEDASGYKRSQILRAINRTEVLSDEHIDIHLPAFRDLIGYSNRKHSLRLLDAIQFARNVLFVIVAVDWQLIILLFVGTVSRRPITRSNYVR